MNVFDWRGPQFVLFYLVFGVALYFIARQLRAWTDPRGARDPTPNDDPYLVACLRGGPAEAIRVCIVSLLDRGLLQSTDNQLHSAATAARVVRRPLERAIIARAQAAPTRVRDIVRDDSVQQQAALLRDELAAQGFYAVPRILPVRILIYVLCAGAAIWVALHKLLLAIERGRSNVLFLYLMPVALCIALAIAIFPRRTLAGEAHVRALKRLFARTHDNRQQLRFGGQSTELVWLSAVFGLSALPHTSFPEVYQLFPGTRRNANASTSCSSSGCGSSNACGTASSSDSSSSDSSSSCSSSSCGGGSSCGGCGGGGD